MLQRPPKNRPRLRKFLIAGSILVIALGGIYWYMATEKFADTSDRKPSYTVEATAFIKEFEKDNKAANEKYTEKIIVVNGTVFATEAADTTINVKMTDTTTGSYIIFAFQEQHLDEAKSLKAGEPVSIKGSCSGGIYSDILGTNVISFKRSALNKN